MERFNKIDPLILDVFYKSVTHLLHIDNWTYKKAFRKRLRSTMVPSPRIELGTEHYHCSVLPLNHDGVAII
jgi:hypothetical protein